MQKAADEGFEPQDQNNDQNDTCLAVVADLIDLIEHVQASLRLIETAIARETPVVGPESASNVIVLDDVSPRYMPATAALQACDANLGIALRSLLDSRVSEHGTVARAAILPAFSIVGA